MSERDRIDAAIIEAKSLHNKLNDEYTKLKGSVSFFTDLDFYQAAPDVPSIESVIKRIERDICDISPLLDKDILQQTISSSPSEQYFYLDLLDLRETCLSQLVDTLKLKIRTAEQHLECVSVVIDEFGSITNMLDRVRQLLFTHDSLLKPRRLTKYDPATLRAFFVALQNELSVLRREVFEAQKQSEENILFSSENTENIT